MKIKFSLIPITPKFLVNFFDGLQGDYDANPRARQILWPNFYVGMLSIAFAGLAAFFGYPLYKELISSIGFFNSLPYLPSIGSTVIILLILGAIYTLTQNASLRYAEQKEFAASRVSYGKYKRTIFLLVLLYCLDVGMNFGGHTLRLKHKENIETTNALSGSFVYGRQSELDKINNQIYKLNNPKEFNCEGWTACKSTCPLHPGGSVHDPNGSLTKFGRLALADLEAKALPLNQEYAIERARFDAKEASTLSTVSLNATGREAVSYVWIAAAYLLMIVCSVISAGYLLDFEEAAGLLPDYDRLSDMEEAKIARIKERRRLKKERQKMDAQDAQSKTRESEKLRRQRRREREIPQEYEYGNNPNSIEEIFPINNPYHTQNNRKFKGYESMVFDNEENTETNGSKFREFPVSKRNEKRLFSAKNQPNRTGRKDRTKNQIITAMSEIQGRGEKATAAAIAREIGVSDRTVRNYLKEINQ